MQAERLPTRTLAAPAPAHRGSAAGGVVRPLAASLIGLAVAVAAGLGLVLRAHLLTHQALSGDEAVTGLMAQQILQGHLSTFYWGNQYGGGEIYVVALLFAVFGASAVVLNATATVITAVSALLLWRTARRLVPGTVMTDPSGDRWVAQYRQVSRSRHPAWIFYAPDQVPAATADFGSPNRGPFAYPESLFVAKLAQIHVGFRLVHAGVLDAVVTDRTVTQGQVGMGGPLYP